MQSIIIAMMIFGFVMLGFVYLLDEGFTNYNIDDTTDLSNNGINFTQLSSNLTDKLTDGENTTSRFSPTGTDDDQWKGILGLWNKIEDFRTTLKTIQVILTNTFSFIPKWVLPSLFGILFFVLLMRGVFVWFKVKP